MREEKHTI